MTAKTFEVRDAMTFIPVLAVRLDPGTARDRYLIARAGYGTLVHEQSGNVLLAALSGYEMRDDPYGWTHNRTMKTAHEFIRANFDRLESGAVIDTEYIRGETNTPKETEEKEARL